MESVDTVDYPCDRLVNSCITPHAHSIAYKVQIPQYLKAYPHMGMLTGSGRTILIIIAYSHLYLGIPDLRESERIYQQRERGLGEEPP